MMMMTMKKKFEWNWVADKISVEVNVVILLD
jgi:hypothetical protein